MQLCVILEKVTELIFLSFKTFRIVKMKSAFKMITHLAAHVTFHSSGSLNFNEVTVFNCFSSPKTLERLVVILCQSQSSHYIEGSAF